MRAVLDTNVLINGFSDDFSAEAKLIDAVREGEITAVVTPAITREYHKLLNQLISDPHYRQRIDDFLAQTEIARPASDNTSIDDEDDRKFIAAAIGGEADIIITSDRHLLDIGEVDKTRIATPQEAWNIFQEEQGGANEWQQFMKGLGIGE